MAVVLRRPFSWQLFALVAMATICFLTFMQMASRPHSSESDESRMTAAGIVTAPFPPPERSTVPLQREDLVPRLEGTVRSDAMDVARRKSIAAPIVQSAAPLSPTNTEPSTSAASELHSPSNMETAQMVPLAAQAPQLGGAAAPLDSFCATVSAEEKERKFLPEYYMRNVKPKYDLDTKKRSEKIHQYNIYNTAALLADSLAEGANGWIIDLGCGNGRKAATLFGKGFNLFIIDFKDNLEAAREAIQATERYRNQNVESLAGFAAIEWNINDFDAMPSIPDSIVQGAVVISADVIEHVIEPEHLLAFHASVIQRGGFASVISTPEREKLQPKSTRPKHGKDVQLWQKDELKRFIACTGMLPQVECGYSQAYFKSDIESPTHGLSTIICASSASTQSHTQLVQNQAVVASDPMAPSIPNFTASSARRTGMPVRDK
uniref:Methyltransferase type 11 domain-containing protein n=1 Tax=Chromera velia CCMP2878 TaxID=1169474 RepID=A0A0G4FH99_9ALVE|eukprot:Cvel_3338.t1-p1 / transcript=Cvel_3338.t1 / gene=Cvel_3338 / organism=Chromera_velia_CCMP2878 / gene_product=hypothetical protein / transcript_product=hypothetical protein / location=Cvel_scaffold133:28660-29958(-) / protein_length=433 / sequence_SO=supercontig / SO=protein_coding / is_pseudo=false